MGLGSCSSNANMTEESLLSFPCDIPVKIFGRNDANFREAVLTIVRSHFSDFTQDDTVERPSRGSKYVSLTVTVRAQSREQIDAAYQALSAEDRVMMVL